MKVKKVKVQTYEKGEVEIKLKSINSIYSNLIQIKPTYFQWLKDGKLEMINYSLFPESMEILHKILLHSKYAYKFNLKQVEDFLKDYPTKEILDKKLREDKELPLV